VVGDVGLFEVSPDGTHAVYAARQDGDDVHGLYSVSLDRSRPPVALHRDLANGLDASVFALAVTPDGSQVVFARREFVVAGLYVAPLDGSRAPELLAEPWAGLEGFLELSPDGNWGLLVQPDGLRIETLFRVDGSVPPLGRDLSVEPAFDPSSRFLVERRHSFTGDLELFSVRLDGTGTSVRLDALPSAGRSVVSTAITPDGASVLYVADQDVDERFELHRVPSTAVRHLSGSAPGPWRAAFPSGSSRPRTRCT
jgi:Tol biopolymer transport system component